MGQLKVINGGIQLDGQALILDDLRTSILRSRHGQPITFGNVYANSTISTIFQFNFFTFQMQNRIVEEHNIQYKRC